MARKIASLYAEITADTSGIERGLSNTRRELERTEGSVKSHGTRWTEFASKLGVAQQAFGYVQQGAQIAYDTLKQGAALEAASSKFDNLATSVGSAASVMLNDMREATSGMVSDADLVASANELMSLKLAKSHDEVVRMSTAAGKLGWDMQVLGLTIANKSTMRLDALGLAIEDVVPRFNELKKTMSEDEAFKLAVIEAGEDKVRLLGDAADTTAGQLQALEAAVANVSNETKSWFAQQLAPTVASATPMVNAFSGAWADLRGAVDDGNISLFKANALLAGSIFGFDSAQEGLSELRREAEEYNRVSETWARIDAQRRGSTEDVTDAIEDQNVEIVTGTGLINQYLGPALEMERQMRRTTVEAEQQNRELQNQQAELSGISRLIQELEGEHSSTMNLRVMGLDNLERAQAALAGLRGFNANDAPDPFSSSGDRYTQEDALDPTMGGINAGRFANGGQFVVGGSGGIDSQRVSFLATPGETVTVTQPGQSAGVSIGNITISTSGGNADEIARDISTALARQLRAARVAGAGRTGRAY